MREDVQPCMCLDVLCETNVHEHYAEAVAIAFWERCPLLVTG
jgi:hypothetical protein